MELASEEEAKYFLGEAKIFIHQPWQVHFKYQSSVLAIAEYLAYKEGKTLYEVHLKQFKKRCAVGSTD